MTSGSSESCSPVDVKSWTAFDGAPSDSMARMAVRVRAAAGSTSRFACIVRRLPLVRGPMSGVIHCASSVGRGSPSMAKHPSEQRSRLEFAWACPPCRGAWSAIRGKRRRRARAPQVRFVSSLLMSIARVLATVFAQLGNTLLFTGVVLRTAAPMSSHGGHVWCSGICEPSGGSGGGACGFCHAEMMRNVHCGPAHVAVARTNCLQAVQVVRAMRSNHHRGGAWFACRWVTVMWFFIPSTVPRPLPYRVWWRWQSRKGQK